MKEKWDRYKVINEDKDVGILGISSDLYGDFTIDQVLAVDSEAEKV